MLDSRRHGREWDAWTMGVTDADLVRAATQGDAAALGIVLYRHRPALLAIAVGMVGRDDAEDIVHDAFLVALRHIGALRDPSAAGSWLRAIVCTQSLMRLRARREQPADDLHNVAGAASDATPEEVIERLALRDWVWSAIERLSEPLQIVALLRHFSTHCSYDEIARILGLPVGTVRSRLNQVRLKLADALMQEATLAHPDVGARNAATGRYYRDGVDAANRGDLSGYAERWAPDIRGVAHAGPTVDGRERLAQVMTDGTPGAGVLVRLDRVIASSRLTILEAHFENPSDAPEHCPLPTTQVHFHPQGRTRSILFTFGERRTSAETAPRTPTTGAPQHGSPPAA
jgi:RNA polymerase sigma-70 factor (ECF subfamily)